MNANSIKTYALIQLHIHFAIRFLLDYKSSLHRALLGICLVQQFD